ncbi:MAG: ABC transporter ATP-binding protein [Pseudomonadota bacterium]
MKSSSDYLVQTQGLHTYYGESHILRGIDLAVKSGETIGLLGRNGMGKSTLIRSIMGLVQPRSGDVFINGTRTNGKATYYVARQGVAYVPEGRGIFPNLSVHENLVMSARSGKQGRMDWTYDKVLEAFPRLGERINNGGWELSGGEQQMLTIGRALMTNPELLILDEATEGLAPLVAAEIWRMVRRIKSSGIATVVVDKNYSAITQIADRNIVLVKGQVVFDGSSEQVRADPSLVSRHLGV